MNNKKILLCVAPIIFIVALVCVLWGKEISTISSVHQVGDNKYLYEMEYRANYDLDEIVRADIDENAKLLQFVVSKVTKGLAKGSSSKPEAEEGDHCTSFQAKNAEGEGYLYGRNYDFYKNPTIVVHSHPKHGYASLSVCDMHHFGYDMEKLPTSIKSKVLCIASIYAPMDGINEKGLCTSIMALPKQASRQNTGKHVVGTTILMRLFLDRCATVDEALEFLSSIDVRHDAKAGSGYHYMVADASGKCAVIEFDKEDGWKTMIVRKPEDMNYMVVTNHLLDPKYYTDTPDVEVGNPHSKSWWRYDTITEFMNERDGIISSAEAQEALSMVHWEELVWPDGMIEDTQFSNVYDQSKLTLMLRPWNDYDKTYEFSVAD